MVQRGKLLWCKGGNSCGAQGETLVVQRGKLLWCKGGNSCGAQGETLVVQRGKLLWCKGVVPRGKLVWCKRGSSCGAKGKTLVAQRGNSRGAKWCKWGNSGAKGETRGNSCGAKRETLVVRRGKILLLWCKGGNSAGAVKARVGPEVAAPRDHSDHRGRPVGQDHGQGLAARAKRAVQTGAIRQVTESVRVPSLEMQS